MKVDLQDLSPVKKRMSVEVDADEVERETEGVLRGYRARAKIPGFRPGKAPLSVIRSRFSKDVEEDVRERIVTRAILEGARERGLEPLGNPALDEISHEKGAPLRFCTTFEVLPPIEPKSYSKVDVRRVLRRVENNDIETVLAEIRQSRARLVTETDRAAAPGDAVFVDLEGMPEGGEAFRREGAAIEIGAPGNPPGFDRELTGVRAGDEREILVEPSPAAAGQPPAGKPVRYRLAVREVKRREFPEVDDEFAKDLGEFDDLAALRSRIGQDLEARNQREADKALRQSILDKVLVENPVVLPDILVEGEVRRRLEEGVRGLAMQGIDVEKSDIDWEKLHKAQQEPARKSVHARLMLDAIARAESIAVEDSELEDRIVQEARRMGDDAHRLRSALRKHDNLEALRAQLLREKTLDYLVGVANIQNEE